MIFSWKENVCVCVLKRLLAPNLIFSEGRIVTETTAETVTLGISHFRVEGELNFSHLFCYRRGVKSPRNKKIGQNSWTLVKV